MSSTTDTYGRRGKQSVSHDDDEEEQTMLLELSEDELKINDQAQADELLAMESIYGDSVFILAKQNGLRCFQIHIHVETTSQVSVSVKLNSSAVPETKDDLSDISYSVEVEYLPPIVLSCVLPPSYPSHRPPDFTISVQWLDATKISSLCGILDSIWNQQPGQEVIYHWVEWLQSSYLSFFGFVQEITLGPYDRKHETDKRAISGSISAEVDIQSIRVHNDELCSEKFLTAIHECCICFSEFSGTGFARLPCQHFFCWTCMKTYSDMHVKEGTVLKILCPDAKCGGMIPPGLLRRLLSNEDYERWESMMLQKTLESMSDTSYCPRCETICIEDEGNHALCSKCFFSFCSLCRERWHSGRTCISEENKFHNLLLKEWQKSSQIGTELGTQTQIEVFNIFLSLREINYSASCRCPSCKMAITRISGCNKMVCACGCHFCYHCCQKLDQHDYSVCRSTPRGTRRDFKEGIYLDQVLATFDSIHNCPNCHQLNVKSGSNNRIVCRTCQTPYCYLCRKQVRWSAEHYGPNGCQQHTKDK